MSVSRRLFLTCGLVVLFISSNLYALDQRDPPVTIGGGEPVLGTLRGRFVFGGKPPFVNDLEPWLSRAVLTRPLRRDDVGRVSGIEMLYREYLQRGIQPDTRDASLQIGVDGGIANVLVWVTSMNVPWTPPKGIEVPPVSIRIQDGNFSPRFTVLTAGQTVLFENHDPVIFNVHTSPVRNVQLNVALNAKSFENPARWTCKVAEKLPFTYRSDIQTWAKGWIFVHSTPFAALSQSDGTFTIPNLPPGEWEFTAWHERCGWVTCWPRGQFKQVIKPGLNDLGTIELKPELPDQISARLTAMMATSNSQSSAAAQRPREGADPKPRDIRIWSAVLVDGLTDRPLQDITVRVRGARVGAQDPQLMTLQSDANGSIKVPLDQGTGTTIQIATAGWWSPNWAFIGEFGQATEEQDKANLPDAAKPPRIKLWKGTRVAGKLVTPDGEPAAGIGLNAGVYLNNVEWKTRLGMETNRVSYDHGDWPNWVDSVVTGSDGTFAVSVPPAEARSWVRVGTTELGLGPAKGILQYAPLEIEVDGYNEPSRMEPKHRLDLGTLKLERGRVLSGKVLDADGQPLAGVHLVMSSPSRATSGRSTVSDQDGRFEFLPLKSGVFLLTVDAHFRNEKGEYQSRDVRAVFIPRDVTLPEKVGRHEITVRAIPHRTLEFEWIDRRKKKGPVSYYGEFKVSGQVPREEANPVWWHGETEKIERDGRELLFVKIPATLTKATLHLPADSVVTASYEDGQTKSGPGQIELGDVRIQRRRIIFGDEPLPSK